MEAVCRITAVVTSIDRFPESRPKTVVYLLMVLEPGVVPA